MDSFSNMSDTSTDTGSYEDLLHDANYDKVIELLPIILVMSILGIVGIVGNTVTIKFYNAKRRKTPTIYLIISLAVVDLIVCGLFVPNIVEMCINVLYTNAVACKIVHFVGHLFVESSGLILGFIAFDRYWKICGHTRRKITKTVAKKAVVIILVFSCVMSVRDFVNFDIVTVNLDKTFNSSSPVGHYCTTSDDADLQISVLVFHAIDALTFILILLIIIFTYSNVLVTLCKIDKMRRKIVHAKSDKCKEPNQNTVKARPTTNASGEEQSSKEPVQLPQEPAQLPSSTQTIEEDPGTCCSVQENITTLQRKRAKTGNRKIRKSEKNVTMLMLAVSTAFFLCASPYFVVKIGIRSVKRSSDLELGLLIQFCLRLGYINSVLNPLIYCLFNPSFRRHMKRVLLCKRKDTIDGEFYLPTATSDWSTAVSRNSDDK